MPTPTRSQVADVARRTADHIEKLLRKAGHTLDPDLSGDAQPELALDEPGLAAMVCEPRDGPSDSPIDPCGEDRGIADLELFLDDGQEAYYFGEGVGGPDPTAPGTTSAGLAYFYDVTPGPRTVTIRPLDGSRRLSCSGEQPGGVVTARMQGTQVSVPVRPALNNFAGEVYCTLE